MIVFQISVLLLAIYLGTKLQGLGLGIMGGLGLAVLTFVFKLKPDNPPFEVLIIIIAITTTTGALEVSGGMHYLTKIAEKLIRRYPNMITFMSPLVVYVIAFFAGTGHTVYSLLPVIADVSKDIGVRPEKPLSVAVIAAQQACIASPISAPTAVVVSLLSPYGIEPLKILLVCLFSTLIGVFMAGLVVNRIGRTKEDKFCDDLDSSSKKQPHLNTSFIHAKCSLFLFGLGIFTIVITGSIKSLRPYWLVNDKVQYMEMSSIIPIVMLAVSGLILLLCKVNPKDIMKSNTFSAGIQAVVGILGMSWLGTTFIKSHESGIVSLVKEHMVGASWQFCIVLFVVAMLLASQTATLRIMIPLGLSVGLSAIELLAVLPAVNSVFFIPNHPAILAAVNLDTTKSTKIGKYVLNHSFMVPGLVATITAVVVSHLIIKFIL